MELLDKIDDCYGPCSRICVSCPLGESVREIRDVVKTLVAERCALLEEIDRLRKTQKE
jgi:hypothetical protein